MGYPAARPVYSKGLKPDFATCLYICALWPRPQKPLNRALKPGNGVNGGCLVVKEQKTYLCPVRCGGPA